MKKQNDLMLSQNIAMSRCFKNQKGLFKRLRKNGVPTDKRSDSDESQEEYKITDKLKNMLAYRDKDKAGPMPLILQKKYATLERNRSEISKYKNEMPEQEDYRLWTPAWLKKSQQNDKDSRKKLLAKPVP